MWTVGTFEMETEGGSVCAHITHTGTQSLQEDREGCRVRREIERGRWGWVSVGPGQLQ